MARTSGTDGDLAITEVAALCESLLRQCTSSALHLELRDSYTPGDAWLRAWLEGDRTEFERHRELARPWFDLIAETTGRGVEIRRLRVVSEPVSDYIRFEHATTDSNVAAGEQVRWLARIKAADLLLPGNDCWIFDHRLVLFNWFDGSGEWDGGRLCEDESVARQHEAAFAAAWERALRHADYRLS